MWMCKFKCVKSEHACEWMKCEYELKAFMWICEDV
jgi:hypothetical protein